MISCFSGILPHVLEMALVTPPIRSERQFLTVYILVTGRVISNGPQFASFITFFFRSLEIFSCQHVKLNNTKLFSHIIGMLSGQTYVIKGSVWI